MTDVPALPAPGQIVLAGARAPSRRDAGLRVAALVLSVLTLLGVAVVLTAVATMPPAWAAGLNSSVAASLQMVGMAGLALAAAALARQRPRATIAWLMLGTALAWVLTSLALLGALALRDAGSGLAAAAGWLTNWTWVPAQALSMLLLLRFPGGSLPDRRWRVVELAVLAWAGLTVLVTATLPGSLGPDALAPLTNPLGVEALRGRSDALLSGLFGVLPALVLASAAAPVVRWRRAGTRERGALRWLAVAALAVAVSAPLALVGEAGAVLQGLAFLLLPVAIGTAVLRDQLWDLDLRRRYDRLREARNQERERLRHELHDSLGPVLGSISMRAEAARNLLAADSPDTARVDGLLASIGTTTEDALAEVRRLIDDLGPAALHDQDLVPALESHLRAYDDSFPVTLELVPDPLPPVEERAAVTAYLVVVEAVRNAARHSGGTGACVRVSADARRERLVVEVRDDGVGVGSTRAGVGRTGMARRAAEEGGRLRVGDAPGPGPGTVVRLELPGALR